MNGKTNRLATLLDSLRRSLTSGMMTRSSSPSPNVTGPNGISDQTGEGPALASTAPGPNTVKRDVGAFGIMVNHLLYDATALAEVHPAMPHGQKIEILSNPHDLGEVHARLPDGRTIVLRAVDHAYACGLSLHAHLAMLRDPQLRAACFGLSAQAGKGRPASRPVPSGECAELNALLERRASR